MTSFWSRSKPYTIQPSNCLPDGAHSNSNKTHKKTFYTKLKETIDLGIPRSNQADTHLQKLESIRAKLNAYCEALHQVIPERDIRPIEAMGCLVALGQEPPGLRKPNFLIMNKWCYPEFKNRIDLVARIQAKVKQIGLPSNNPFFDSAVDLLLPEDKLLLTAQIKDARENLIVLQEAVLEFSGFLGLQSSLDFANASMLKYAADRAVTLPSLEGVSVSLDAWAKNRLELETAVESGKRFLHIRELYKQILKQEAWDADVVKDRDILDKYGAKWWRFLVTDYWKTHKKLRGLFQAKYPKLNTERLEVVNYILESQSKQREIKQRQLLCQKYFGAQWNGENSEWQALGVVLKTVIDLQKEVGQNKLPKDLLRFLEASYDRDSLKIHAARIHNSLELAEKNLRTVLEFLKAQQNLGMLYGLRPVW